jgi:hypothetical protein
MSIGIFHFSFFIFHFPFFIENDHKWQAIKLFKL